MSYYEKTIKNLTDYEEKLTPTKIALAELSEKIQAEIYNEGGNGFIMPFIPVTLTENGKRYLPHRLRDIKELLS